MSRGSPCAFMTARITTPGLPKPAALYRTWKTRARFACIPHYAFNFKESFEKDVISDFINEYINGRTPNPCIECNRKIKFDKMLRRAETLGYDKIATGHYARVKRAENGRYLLCRPTDINKDQTYVLYSMTQEELSKTLFPLGDLTKPQALLSGLRAKRLSRGILPMKTELASAGIRE